MSSRDSITQERDPETVALFVEESLEGLQRVERMLLAAEKGHPPAEIVSTLFRELHTIKGTSGFLNLMRIQALSHAAEDLLAAFRDKTVEARPAHYTVLVEVGDTLKRMINQVRRTNDEGEKDVGPLVARLRAAVLGTAAPAEPELPLASATARLAITSEPEIAAAAASDSADPDGSVRVAVNVIDNLLDLIGELVLARNQVVQTINALGHADQAGVLACQRLSAVTSELQAQITKTRLQPVARAFDKVPRMVRDLARATQKQVTTQINGSGTEIDRALVESLRDPVMHIVRNAIDHGIEAPAERITRGKPAAGKLVVRASHGDGVVTIEIEDDGRGMDPMVLREHAVHRQVLSKHEAEQLSDDEVLELVFRPGFSTAAEVTSISGRGVGMDVVRTEVERAGGQVRIESTPGKGTIIRLDVPLSLAIIPVLLVSAGGQRFAIPESSLLELLLLDGVDPGSNIEHVRGVPVHRLRGEMLPLVSLASVLGLGGGGVALAGANGANVVVVNAVGRKYGLVVDAIHDNEEIVVKPLHGGLKRIPCYAGAAVLGDGGVALILEAKGVAARAGVDLESPAKLSAEAQQDRREQRHAAVLFRAGDGVQCIVPLSMVARLDRIAASAIERVGATEVVQYRQSVMPILRPESVVPMGRPGAAGDDQALIVFEFGGRVAFAVNGIVDVVELEPEATSHVDDTPFTLGKAVVNGRTTLVLDVYRIVRELAPCFISDRRRSSRALRVVVSDGSGAMRGALSAYLRSLGVEVVESDGAESLLRELRSARDGGVSAVVTELSLGDPAGFDLIATLRCERPTLPIFGWVDEGDDQTVARALEAGVKACVSNLRREELTAAFERSGLGFRRSDDRKERRPA